MRLHKYLVKGVTDISYRPMELAMSGWTSYNGLTSTIGYDSDLRPTAITQTGVESLAFSYDAANRLTHITNGLDSAQSETLGYDAMNRLISVTSTADNESYSYDADGNRLNAMINGVGWTYTPSGTSNRLASLSSDGSIINFKYDPEGDTFGYSTGTPTQMFYYNVFDRLSGTYVNGLTTHYEVDAEGQRLYKYTTTTNTYFAPGVGGNLLAEDQNGTWMDYVYLNGRLMSVMANGGVYPVASDQTGRPVALTHPTTKAVLWSTQTLPFGGGTVVNHWGGFNLGFPGQYFDQEDGLWYNGHRDYDAALGRYIESDPIGLAGGVNTYVYTGDDPINSVDPLGLCPTCSQLQQEAAQVAEGLKQMSHESEALAGVGAFATAVGVVGETGFGLDTPYTVSVGAATEFFGTTAAVTGGLSAAFNTFATSGNPQFIASFTFKLLVSSGVHAATTASDIPFASRFADNLGQLAGEAAGLATEAQEACQSQ